MKIKSNPFESTINELAALGDQNKKIEKALKDYLVKIEKRADEEKKSINSILSILAGKSSSSAIKSRKSRKSINITDNEILQKVKDILSGGKKLSQSAVLNQIGIPYNRFRKFRQSHSDLFGHEGKNKSNVLFLK